MTIRIIMINGNNKQYMVMLYVFKDMYVIMIQSGKKRIIDRLEIVLFWCEIMCTVQEIVYTEKMKIILTLLISDIPILDSTGGENNEKKKGKC